MLQSLFKTRKLMKYFILDPSGKAWTQTKLEADYLGYHWLKLYNDDLTDKGMGMVRPSPTREEFTRLKETWSKTLANLNHHLEEDKF